MSVLMLSLVLGAVGVMAAAPPRFPFDDFASHGYDAVLGSPFAASDPGWRPSRVSVCVWVWVCVKSRGSRAGRRPATPNNTPTRTPYSPCHHSFACYFYQFDARCLTEGASTRAWRARVSACLLQPSSR
jgi:hypothetical protein